MRVFRTEMIANSAATKKPLAKTSASTASRRTLTSRTGLSMEKPPALILAGWWLMVRGGACGRSSPPTKSHQPPTSSCGCGGDRVAESIRDGDVQHGARGGVADCLCVRDRSAEDQDRQAPSSALESVVHECSVVGDEDGLCARGESGHVPNGSPT